MDNHDCVNNNKREHCSYTSTYSIFSASFILFSLSQQLSDTNSFLSTFPPFSDRFVTLFKQDAFRLWTFKIKSIFITEAQSVLVTQDTKTFTGTLADTTRSSSICLLGRSKCKIKELKITAGSDQVCNKNSDLVVGSTKIIAGKITKCSKSGTTFTFTISEQLVDEENDVSVYQTHTYIGTLDKSLTGAGMATVLFTTVNDNGIKFVKDVDVKVGSTNIAKNQIISVISTVVPKVEGTVASSSTTTSLVVNVATGVIFRAWQSLKTSGSTILVNAKDVSQALNSGVTPTVVVNVASDFIWKTTKIEDVTIGSSGRILASTITGATNTGLANNIVISTNSTKKLFEKTRSLVVGDYVVNSNNILNATNSNGVCLGIEEHLQQGARKGIACNVGMLVNRGCNECALGTFLPSASQLTTSCDVCDPGKITAVTKMTQVRSTVYSLPPSFISL